MKKRIVAGLLGFGLALAGNRWVAANAPGVGLIMTPWTYQTQQACINAGVNFLPGKNNFFACSGNGSKGITQWYETDGGGNATEVPADQVSGMVN